ncbi:MAG: carboxypeptidase regulatory-like domain-containing protein [candidate division Zixibacteria bacterium]|nr:carboxypeptidase regulatory-like domain-containing protein [candidate division Zixibacteria bacterium]
MKKLFIFLTALIFILSASISLFARVDNPSTYASISGKVTDQKTGEPLVKAFVMANKLDGRKLVARTDSSGVYLLDKLSAGRYELSAFAFGYFLKVYPETLTVKSGDNLTGINFELSTMPTGSISGRVTDSLTGNPIVHARIFVHNIEGCEKSLAFSDSDGNYVINKLQVGFYRATAFARGYKPLKYFTPVEVIADSIHSGVDFQMKKHGHQREGKIFGQVKDQETCLPIPFADVIAYSTSPDQEYQQTAITDEDGKYVLEDLPIIPFKVLGTATGYISEYYKEALLEEDAHKVTPTSSQVDFGLSGTQEGFLNIGGRTTLDGKPLENATVYAISKIDPFSNSEEISALKVSSLCGNIAASAVSSSEGEYLLEKLLPGTYYLLVTSPYGTVNGPQVELKFKTFCGVDINIGRSDVKEDNTSLPKKMSLSQNYPNPFNPATTIQFKVGSLEFGEPVHTSLTIYNLAGQKVRVLLDEEMIPGDYQAIWDGKDDNDKKVSSGIYFYRFKAGDNSETKKMIMLK